MMKTETKFKQTEIGMIPEDWLETTIGNKCNIKNGKTNTQDAIECGQYPLYDRSSKIKRSNKFLFDCEAIIIPGEGKHFIPKFYSGKFDLHQRAYAIWNKSKKSDIKFIYYWIIKNSHYLENIAVGSTVKSLRLNHLENFPLQLPSLPEQKAIAKILSSLDEKIELNNKMNKTLEAIGRTIFKKWFVEGKKEGWEEEKLGEFCDILNGYAFKSKDYCQKGIFLLRTRNFSTTYSIHKENPIFLPDSFYYKYKNFQLKKFDLLLIMVGASVGNMGFVTSNILPALQNQNMWNFRAKEEFNQLFLKFLLEEIVRKNLSSASGSARNFFRKDFFKSILIKKPNEDLLLKFNKIVTSLYNEIDKNICENENLAKIRDSLLPKLMCGEVRVNG